MRNSRHHSQRGFSFIEILIVMGIIATLAGLTIVAVQIFAREGPQMQTKTTLQKVQALIGTVKTQMEIFPPLDITRCPKLYMMGPEKVRAPGNDSNAGIEVVYQSLFWDGMNVEPSFGDGELKNTDEDELGKAAISNGNPALLEIVDAWGNPLVYIPATDYAKVENSPVHYILGDLDREGEQVEVRPWKSEHGGYARPNSFQLFSMGPDGEPNTEDDLKAWEN